MQNGLSVCLQTCASSFCMARWTLPVVQARRITEDCQLSASVPLISDSVTYRVRHSWLGSASCCVAL